MPSLDPPDFTALLDRYERPLVRYAQSIVGDLDSARDVVQDVFIKLSRGGMRTAEDEATGSDARQSAAEAWRDSAAGGGGSAIRNPQPRLGETVLRAEAGAQSAIREPQLQAWLFTVTRNRALDHQRKHRRIIPMPIPDDRPCEAPSPAATLERRDGEASLLRLLDALPPNQREVIRLKFQNDLSYREIAEVTQLTVTNVGFLLHTGLKKLRTLAAELPQDDLNLHFRNASAV